MDSQWLKSQFDFNPHKSKAGLAKALGLEPPAISKILKGNRQIKAQEYFVMRDYFGLPSDGYRALQGNIASEGALKEISELQDPPFEKQANWSIPSDISGTSVKRSIGNIKIIQIHENLMEPAVTKGDNVVVDISDQNLTVAGLFIINDGYRPMIRQCELVGKSNPPQVKISASSESFQTQLLQLDELTIMGRVIARLEWL